MIKATDIKAGLLYRRTRRSTGLPNTYYRRPDDKVLARMRKRLARKPDPDMHQSQLLQAIVRGDVVLAVFSRWTEGTTRKETKRWMWMQPSESARLRCVRRKPGYVTS